MHEQIIIEEKERRECPSEGLEKEHKKPMRGERIGSLLGERFGRLTVIRKVPNVDGFAMWECICTCGRIKAYKATALNNGKVKSCGCLRSEVSKAKCYKIQVERGCKYGLNTHEDRLYKIWCNMKSRCYNEKVKEYKNYGARGIVVCSEWLTDYAAFKTWATSTGYRSDLSLDRIDVNANYEPSNCRWVDMTVQANNRRNNRFITVDGITKTVSQWADELGMKPNTISDRLRRGWNEKRALGLEG